MKALVDIKEQIQETWKNFGCFKEGELSSMLLDCQLILIEKLVEKAFHTGFKDGMEYQKRKG